MIAKLLNNGLKITQLLDNDLTKAKSLDNYPTITHLLDSDLTKKTYWTITYDCKII